VLVLDRSLIVLLQTVESVDLLTFTWLPVTDGDTTCAIGLWHELASLIHQTANDAVVREVQ
jgi:hypothetical protein